MRGGKEGRMEDGRAMYQLYVGIDVAAEPFVVAWISPGGKPATPCTGEQTPTGFAALQRRLQGTGAAPAATAGGPGGHRQLLGRPRGGPP